MYRTIKKYSLFILGLSFGLLYGQESPTAAGGEATGGGTVSFSVGQVAYTTQTGTNGSELQGVQQPYEIYTLSVIDLDSPILSIYPNPTSGLISLESSDPLNETLHYEITDANGKSLGNYILTGQLTQIDLTTFESSTYFITVTNATKHIATYKIIKK